MSFITWRKVFQHPFSVSSSKTQAFNNFFGNTLELHILLQIVKPKWDYLLQKKESKTSHEKVTITTEVIRKWDFNSTNFNSRGVMFLIRKTSSYFAHSKKKRKKRKRKRKTQENVTKYLLRKKLSIIGVCQKGKN